MEVVFKQQILELIVLQNIDGSVERNIKSKGGSATCIAGIAGKRYPNKPLCAWPAACRQKRGIGFARIADRKLIPRLSYAPDAGSDLRP
jgi:hypothetical protein